MKASISTDLHQEGEAHNKELCLVWVSVKRAEYLFFFTSSRQSGTIDSSYCAPTHTDAIKHVLLVDFCLSTPFSVSLTSAAE